MEVDMKYTERVETGEETLLKEVKKNRKHTVVFGIISFTNLLIVSLLAGVVFKELVYVRDTLDTVHEIKPEVDNIVNDFELTHFQVKVITRSIEETKKLIDFTLEMLIRFCRIPGYMDYCMMPVPPHYNITFHMLNVTV